MSHSTTADVTVLHSSGTEDIDEVRNNFLDPSLHFDQRFLLLRDNVNLTISWARQLADSLIARRLASRELDSEGECSSAIYYSKLLRAAFEKRAVWLTPSVQSNRSGTFSIPEGDITAERLLKSLEVPVTSCLIALAEGIVTRVRNCSPRKSGELVERSTQVKTFVYDHHTNSFNAIITVLDIKLLITYRVMHKNAKERVHEGLRGFAFKPLLDLGYGLQSHLTPSYLKSPGRGGEAIGGSPGYMPGSLVLNAELPHRSRMEKERMVIHVESEISMVQYEFSDNIFMELRDTIIEMILGKENNDVTILGD